jgi:hypothetical protein
MMAGDDEEAELAAQELTHAMSRLVRAIDSFGDDGQAVRHISERLPEAMRELADRLDAAFGLSTG